MNSFPWDKTFETGLIEVDQQHHHLVGIINEFGNILIKDQIAFDDIEQVFKELADYT